jgi:flagellin
VDEGESTVWTLPNKLDPATLNLSKVVATSQVTSGSVGASYNAGGAAVSGTLNNMSELTTGDYSFQVLDKAASSTTVGKTNLDSTSKLVTGVSGLAGSATAASASTTAGNMVSGHYKLSIDAATSSTSTSYTITNLDDNTWGVNGSVSVTNADLSSGSGSSGNLVDAANATMGINLGFTGGAAAGAAGLATGTTMTFEYIKAGDVKLQMTDSSGQALSINRHAAAGTTNYSATSAYVAAAGVYQSGRGASITMNTAANWGSISSTVGNKTAFTYEQANLYSVDVSNATKAGKYMTTANNALDKITSALSDLGSLMSRLSFKEDQVSTAQINVESSYSRIMNANMAEEQVNSSKFAILQQTATAMLAQANTAPQNLLSLFR